MEKIEIKLDPLDNKRLLNLCGPLNNNIKEIELRFDVVINQRGNFFNFLGNTSNITLASEALKNLYVETKKIDITTDLLRNFLSQPEILHEKKVILKKEDFNFLEFKNYKVKVSTSSQNQFLKEINKNDLVFSIGAAGSGKTFIAIAAALNFYELGKVKKIILVRPVVEAGENLGFLPGDISQKIDPYLRPMFDAFNVIMNAGFLNKMIDQNIIEFAPLAYMRGRTLNDSFIILDEAQNSTKEQMKMFLTRMGKNSKVVVTGDITQIDLSNAFSGLLHVLPIVSDIQEISICKFSENDILRHSLVKKIIKAYAKDT